jgi:hypothetical protein
LENLDDSDVNKRAKNQEMMKPFLLNNLGVTHFYQFIEKSTQITSQEPGATEKGALDKIGDILGHFDKGMKNLKKSVCTFEEFETRFKELSRDAASN